MIGNQEFKQSGLRFQSLVNSHGNVFENYVFCNLVFRESENIIKKVFGRQDFLCDNFGVTVTFFLLVSEKKSPKLKRPYFFRLGGLKNQFYRQPVGYKADKHAVNRKHQPVSRVKRSYILSDSEQHSEPKT